MKLSLRKIEYAWHTLAFVLLMGAFVPLWRQMATGGIDPSEGDPVQRIFLGVAYLGVGLLIFHPHRSARVARRGWLIWVLVGWAALSALWSVAPAITFRRSLAATLGAFYGLLLAVRYKPEEVLRMLGVALGIVVVASLVAIAVVPDWAVMKGLHEGAWRGIFAHKNILGRAMVLAAIVFYALSRRTRRAGRRGWLFFLALSVGLIIGARSMTSLVTLLLVFTAWSYWRWSARHVPLLRPAVFIFGMFLATPVVLTVTTYFEDILEFLGKNITLTGRLPLWILLMPYALSRLWTGYGYGAFWASNESPSVSVINMLPWTPTHAHNGYLDVWLDVGLVGLCLSFALLFNLIKYGIKEALKTKSAYPYPSLLFQFPLCFLVLNITYNLFLEARLGTGIFWTILVWLLLSYKDGIRYAPANSPSIS